VEEIDVVGTSGSSDQLVESDAASDIALSGGDTLIG